MKFQDSHSGELCALRYNAGAILKMPARYASYGHNMCRWRQVRRSILEYIYIGSTPADAYSCARCRSSLRVAELLVRTCVCARKHRKISLKEGCCRMLDGFFEFLIVSVIELMEDCCFFLWPLVALYRGLVIYLCWIGWRGAE